MHVPAPLREIYRDLAPELAVMKGAQLGFSEWAINRGLWVADTGHAVRGNALYVLPGGQHVGDFVQARVNPAIQSSPYLLGRIRPDGNTKDPDKVGLRRIGRGYTYFRTSGSRAGLRTVDADLLVLDEFDEMADWVLPMARHRLDSSQAGMVVLLGTPTHPGIGVDIEFLRGDQRRYEVRCLTCGTWQSLDWQRSVEVSGDPNDPKCIALLSCIECRDELTDSVRLAWVDGSNGRWRATYPDRLVHSYHLSQLYRPGVDLVAIARQLGATSQEAKREAFNQSLGLPYSEAGGKLTEAEIRRAMIGPPRALLAAEVDTFMGVDVGGRLHCYIGKVIDGLPTQIAAFEVDEFEDLDVVMRRYDTRHVVVDAHPELHAAEAFQRRHPGRVWLCNYVPDRWPFTWTDSHDPEGHAIHDERRQYRVDCDRTAILDAVADRIRGETSERWGWQPRMAFARDADQVRGFIDQLTAAERSTKRMPTGKMRAVWDEGSKPDHYQHAMAYAELAMRIDDEGPRLAPFVTV